MTLPTSGSISSDQILTELRNKTAGRNYPLSLDDPDVLALAGKTAPPVTMPDDFYGKSIAPPELTLEAYGDQAIASSSGADGTVSARPIAIARNGTKPYSYSWVFTDNPLSFSIVNSNTSSPTVSKSYVRNTIGGGRATLKLTVNDSGGQTKTQNGILVDLSWDPNP